jgi:hypothetical protein
MRERIPRCGTHPLEPGPRRDKWEAARPIVVGTTSGWAVA